MEIPFSTTPTVTPASAPGVFESVHTDPAQFGANVAEGLQNVGQALSGGGAKFAQVALAQQREYNEAAADQANTDFASKARDLAGQFRTLRGADAMNGRADVLAQIEQTRQDVRAGLGNPELQRMYDVMSRNEQRRYLDEVTTHAFTEGKVWQGDVATGAINNKLNEIATYWNDDRRFAQGVGEIKIQAGKLAQLKGIDPDSDAGKAITTHFTSEAWQSRIRSVLSTDPDLARQLFDANADQLDANHRSLMDAQITQHQYTQMMRDEMATRRAEAGAKRDMETTQSANLAQYTGDVLAGKPLPSNLPDLIRTQQLSPHAAEFLLSMQKRRAAGPEEDRADAVINLHQTLGDPTVTVAEKMDAISAAARSGRIKADTAGKLVDQAMAKDQRADNAVARGAKNAMLSSIGVPDGIVDLSHEEKQRKGEALTEWNDRVEVGGEDPIAVRDDLIHRLAPSSPPAEKPRYGPVSSPADIATVAKATKDALGRNEITQGEAAQQGKLLQRYANFYQLQASRPKPAPKTQSTGGDKAKLKGVTAAGGGS